MVSEVIVELKKETLMLQMKIFPVTQSSSEYFSTNRIKISAKTKKILPKKQNVSLICCILGYFPTIKWAITAAIL